MPQPGNLEYQTTGQTWTFPSTPVAATLSTSDRYLLNLGKPFTEHDGSSFKYASSGDFNNIVLYAHNFGISVSKFYTPFWAELHRTVYFLFNAPSSRSSGWDIYFYLTGMDVPEIAAPETDDINLVIFNGEQGSEAIIQTKTFSSTYAFTQKIYTPTNPSFSSSNFGSIWDG